MTLGSWYKGILLTAALSCLLHEALADCSDEGSDEDKRCDQCFQTLSSFLVNTSNNKYHLRKTFYPPNTKSPDFVTVTYQYSDMSIPSQTWYWSAGLFYFYQPLRVLQFTSLFFGPPDVLRRAVTITLPAQCENAPEDFMQQLTQMLKLYASWQNANPHVDDTYQAKAASLNTLRRDIYPNPYFHQDTVPLLYCFQVLFPFFTIMLTLWSLSVGFSKTYFSNRAEDDDSWATTSAYAFICAEFVFFVFILDIVALALRDRDVDSTEYFNNDGVYFLLFHYPGVVLLFDLIGFTWIVFFVIPSLICKCFCCRFRCLTLAGIGPLCCLASHAHYILIAWLTHPIYASRVGIYYGITIFVHFFVLKQTYKQFTAIIGYSNIEPPQPDSRNGYNYETLELHERNQSRPSQQRTNEQPKPINWYVPLVLAFATFVVLIIIIATQFLITYFVVVIPIDHSIRDTPNTVYTIIQGIITVLLALVAYKVILDPKGSFSISGGIQIALKKLKEDDKKVRLHGKKEWKTLDEEEKLAEVLYKHIYVDKKKAGTGQE